MDDTLEFLARLGVAADTGTRGVRRAYARELKLIDQENDPAAFQELREAYEAALLRAEYRERKAAQEHDDAAPGPAEDGRTHAPATAGAAPEPEPEPEPAKAKPKAMKLAAHSVETNAPALVAPAAPVPAQRSAFETFHANFVRMAAANPSLGKGEVSAELRRCMESGQMLHIGERTRFEEEMAQLLVSGWQPGHDALLPAAIEVFNWATDARRLRRLSYTGAILNCVIDEIEVLNLVYRTERETQLRCAALSRDPQRPSRQDIADILPHLLRMKARYPTLTALLTRKEDLERWQALRQQMEQEAGQEQTGTGASPAPPSSADLANRILWWNAGLLLAAIIFLLVMLFTR